MKPQYLLPLVVGSLLASACGGSALKGDSARTAANGRPQTIQLGGEEAAPEAPSPADASFDEAGPAPAAPAGAAPPASPSAESSRADKRSFEPAPEQDRPGLGTTWGETRFSRVTSTPFQRADSQPIATAALFYNDETGVRAMARRTGHSFFDLQRNGIELGRGAITVRLLSEDGNPLPTFDISSRNYVVGHDGERYTIQIINHTGNRFEAVTTVDGLDVIDGRSGSIDKRGYLINPFSTLEIDGFRQSADEVAAFRFGAVRDSYASKKGEDRNVGVIGVAFFQEAGARFPWTDREVDRRLDADPFPNRFATPPRF